TPALSTLSPHAALRIPRGRVRGERPRARAVGHDPDTLGRDLLVGSVSQVSHRLPADRRVRIKQPLYDRSLSFRGLPLGWIGCHLWFSISSEQFVIERRVPQNSAALHQGTNALPVFSTALSHELYIKKRTTHYGFLPIPRLYSRLPNSGASRELVGSFADRSVRRNYI